MAKCIEIKKLTLPLQEVKTYKGLLRLASAVYQKPQNNIRIFFEHASTQTEIESEDDLMALKYLVPHGNITFKLQISKSKQEIEHELISQSVDEYLAHTYDHVAEQEFQREINQSIEKYLQGLYKRLSEREARQQLRRVQKDEVSNYVNRMTRQIVDKDLPRSLAVRERRTRSVRVSPERELFKRKESHIESMVSRILQSMMPVMVKQLSYRIVEELQNEKQFISLEEELELNPEYV